MSQFRGLQGPAAVVKLDALWDRYSGVDALADAATITVDISTSTKRILDLPLTGNHVLDFIGGSADLDGRQTEVRVTQGAGGSHLLSASANIGFGSDITGMPTLSTTAGKCDRLLFEYRHAVLKHELISFVRGF